VLPADAALVIWLQGASCSGCSVSLLNRISDQAPETAADLLMEVIVLGYHSTLMAAAGDTAVAAAENVYNTKNYFLVVEGGVPQAFNGMACSPWSENGSDVPFTEVVKRYAAGAKGVLCVGNCASWGGLPSKGANVASIVGVSAATGIKTVNVPGCPSHPDWIVWTLAHLLAGTALTLTANGAPSLLFGGQAIHNRCPRKGAAKARTLGEEGRCLMQVGCQGQSTSSSCPDSMWHGGTSWCIGANAPCTGCVKPDFPVAGLIG
jgi:hydrogenase small subunit